MQRWREVVDPVNWTCEGAHGHAVFRRGEGESPQEGEGAGSRERRTDPCMAEGWIAEAHTGCGGRQGYAVRSA
jgi:hypothetical protein